MLRRCDGLGPLSARLWYHRAHRGGRALANITASGPGLREEVDGAASTGLRFTPVMITRPAPVSSTPPEPAVGGADDQKTGRLLNGRAGPLLDAILVLIVVLVAIVVRTRFLSAGPPTFVTPDSDDYLWPGYALASGLGFEPELRRTPLYPIFIGAVLATGGDLATLAAVQHGLGVVTAGLTYGLGRIAFGNVAGRASGLLAGLMVALSGPLVIYEHYLMSEALFTLTLTLALLALVVALRRPSARWLLAAGGAVALAGLARPIGQAVVPIALGLPFLLALPAWRTGLRRVGLVAVGIVLVMAPWTIRNLALHGSTGADGAL